MTRLVRLNEVQYSETEERTAELMAQGFEPEPLEAEELKAKEPKEPKTGKGKSKKTDEGGTEDNPSPEGDEQH